MSVSVETHFVVLIDPEAKGTPSTIAMALAKPPAAAPGDLVKVAQEEGQTVLEVVEKGSGKCKPLLAKPHH